MRAKEWTKEEDAILRRRREERVPVPLIAKELGRPLAGTYARARQIGTRVMERREWDEAEVARLIEMDENRVSLKEIATALDRPENSVRWKLEDLGRGGKRVRYWTAAEDAELARMVNGKTVADVDLAMVAEAIAAATDEEIRPAAAVDARIRNLGLYASIRQRWAVEEIRELKAAVAAGELAEFAERAGRPFERVKAKAVAMGYITAAKGYSEDDDRRIRVALAAGRGFERLARDLGRSKRSVRERAIELGLVERRNIRRIDEDARLEIVAEAKAGTTLGEAARKLRRDARLLKQVAAEEGVVFAKAVRERKPKPVVVKPAVVRREAAVTRVAAEKTVVVRTSAGFRKVTPLPAADMSDAIAKFLAEKGVTREQLDPAEEAVRTLRRRGYAVVSVDGGWVVDGRRRLEDANALAAFAAARGGESFQARAM